jgi:hypothetical protein
VTLCNWRGNVQLLSSAATAEDVGLEYFPNI